MSASRRRNGVLGLLIVAASLIGASASAVSVAEAHQSGCHRWHSCPSDTGSYVCGDLGYPCQYPTYSPTLPTSPAPPPTLPAPIYPPDPSPVIDGEGEYLTKSEVRSTAKYGIRRKWGDRPRSVRLDRCTRYSDVRVSCRVNWRWRGYWKAQITVRETATSYLHVLR